MQICDLFFVAIPSIHCGRQSVTEKSVFFFSTTLPVGILESIHRNTLYSLHISKVTRMLLVHASQDIRLLQFTEGISAQTKHFAALPFLLASFTALLPTEVSLSTQPFKRSRALMPTKDHFRKSPLQEVMVRNYVSTCSREHEHSLLAPLSCSNLDWVPSNPLLCLLWLSFLPPFILITSPS